jgi:PST family polysaccharide transporter
VTDTHTAELDERPALASSVRAGLRWNLLSSIVGRVVTPLVGIVLARVLGADDYGVFAVGLVALNALVSMNDLGMTFAVVRWPGDPSRVAPTATTMAIASSGLLCVLSILAAPSFASLLGAPEAAGVLRLMSIGVIFDGVASVPIAGLMRGFEHRRRVLTDWIGFAFSTGGTLGLALAGCGAWSLGGGRIAGSLATAISVLLASSLRCRPGWDAEVARPLLRFGLPLAGSSLLLFAILSVDYAVVGHELGRDPLGQYLLAFNLSSWPVTAMSTTIRRVSIAGFGQLSEQGEDVHAAFARGVGLLATVAVPVCVGLATLGHPLVLFLYGDSWRPAATAIGMLAVLGGCRVVIDLSYDLLTALGRARPLLVLQGVWLVALAPALVIGAGADGIRGVAAAHAIVAAAVVIPCYVAALARAGTPLRPVLAAVARPIAGGLAAAGAVLALRSSVDRPFAHLVVGGAALAIVYAAIALPIRRLPDLVRNRVRRPITEAGVEVGPVG